MGKQGRRLGPIVASVGAVFCLVGLAAACEASGGEARADADPVGISGPGATVGLRSQKPAEPGSRVTLRLDQSVKPGSHYLWVQTVGPPIDLGEPTNPELRLTVPRGAEALGFLLIVADERGIRTSRVDVPIAPPSHPEADAGGTSRGEATAPMADAGDDLLGLVGHRLTLNGSASRPRAGLAYRWLQVGGPEIRSPVESGSFYSFIPGAPGVYRFALVVARQDRISPPDYVNVTVGSPPGTATSPSSAPASAGDEVDAIVGSSLAAMEDAPALAGPLAEAFDAASFRMDLYQSYAEIYVELSRRLDAIMPQDAARRARWSAAVFEPLTRILIVRMLPTGLDLRSAAGQSAPLTIVQKRELKNQFERTARLLRSVQARR